MAGIIDADEAKRILEKALYEWEKAVDEGKITKDRLVERISAAYKEHIATLIAIHDQSLATKEADFLESKQRIHAEYKRHQKVIQELHEKKVAHLEENTKKLKDIYKNRDKNLRSTVQQHANSNGPEAEFCRNLLGQWDELS